MSTESSPTNKRKVHNSTPPDLGSERKLRTAEEEDIKFINCYGKSGEICALAKVSAVDFDHLNQFRWHIGSGGYPVHRRPTLNGLSVSSGYFTGTCS